MPGRIVIVDSGWQSIAFTGTSVNGIDILEAKLASTQFAYLHSALILQKSEETASNVAEIACSIKRGSGSYTSGSSPITGATATVVKGCTSDPADGLNTKAAFNQTQASAGSGALEDLRPGVMNVRAGEWEQTYIPELRPPILGSQGIVLAMTEGNTENVTMRGILILELFG